MKTMNDTIRVAELFAGVGGFRIGFDRANNETGHAPKYKTIWSNQFEPATKIQHASRTYVKRFGPEGHSNVDINLVPVSDIPDHDLLCGGFPCQDYSVARSLIKSEGIVGKKGVLWWQIVRILKEKGENAPKYLFLENVDRLLGSPSKQKGRDFAMILQSLDELDYAVEWRVINAGEYGMPQRRRRTYILAFKKGTPIYNSMGFEEDLLFGWNWLSAAGIFTKAFPATRQGERSHFWLKKDSSWDIADLSEHFNEEHKDTPFKTGGVMIRGEVFTCKVIPNYTGPRILLGDVLAKGEERKLITEDFYITDEDLPKWKYLKGSKCETKQREGYEFLYKEGPMAFPDPLDKPSRTIITSEGGSTPSRFKHVILDPVTGKYRRLIPLELERLDMFPDNHTEGESDVKRAFFIGNALVIGVITRTAAELARRIEYEEKMKI